MSDMSVFVVVNCCRKLLALPRRCHGIRLSIGGTAWTTLEKINVMLVVTVDIAGVCRQNDKKNGRPNVSEQMDMNISTLKS